MRNKNQVTLGAIVIGLGVLFLIGSITGIRLGRIFWPLVLIGIGVWMLWRPRVVDSNVNIEQRLLGDIKRSGAWAVEETEFWLGVGDADLDLTDADIPLGNTRLRFYGFVGDIDVLVPEGVGVSVKATAFVTDAKVFGQHEDNFFVPYAAKSDNYDIAECKVDIETVYFVTDLKVKIV